MLRFKQLEKQCYPGPQQGQASSSVSQNAVYSSPPPRFVTHITPGQDLTSLFERSTNERSLVEADRGRLLSERSESVISTGNPEQEQHDQPPPQLQQQIHKCRLCGKGLSGRSRSTREYHVWKHIAKAVLQCRYCAKSYHAPHDSNLMIAHVRSAHPGRPVGYQNRMAIYREKMRQMFTKCFPSTVQDREQPMLCRFCGVHVSDTVEHVNSLHLQPNHSDADVSCISLCRFCGVHVSDTVEHVNSLHLQPNHSDADVRRLLNECFGSGDMKTEAMDDEQTLFSSASEIGEFDSAASCDTASVNSASSSMKHQSPADKEIIELE
uniref:C2H2-type domain-containing protein n=1 Tax=Plectus sambesii TaxID=2011161 RepID=A0A914V3W9_9BILA